MRRRLGKPLFFCQNIYSIFSPYCNSVAAGRLFIFLSLDIVLYMILDLLSVIKIKILSLKFQLGQKWISVVEFGALCSHLLKNGSRNKEDCDGVEKGFVHTLLKIFHNYFGKMMTMPITVHFDWKHVKTRQWMGWENGTKWLS